MTLIIIVAAFLASLLTLFSGFGLGTLLMPVVAVIFPVTVAVALTAFVHLLNNLFKLAALWKAVHWRITLTFGIPALLATIPGAWLLTSLSELSVIANYEAFGREAIVTPIKLTVGLLLIVFAIAEWFSFAKKVAVSPCHLPWGGVLSGFFGGLSGHQGAFRSAFLLHAGLDKNQFVATNAAIATLVDMTRLVVYGLNITVLLEQVDTTLIAAATVAAFAGALAGTVGLRKVTLGFIQKLVAVMLLLIGALLAGGLL